MHSGCKYQVHGVATAVAGFYSMDKDPYISTPSRSGQIHGIAGFLIMLSLYIAPIALFFSSVFGISFHAFSAFCLLISIWSLWKTAKAFKVRNNAGLYQRLCYGAQLVWLAGLSLYMLNLSAG